MRRAMGVSPKRKIAVIRLGGLWSGSVPIFWAPGSLNEPVCRRCLLGLEEKILPDLDKKTGHLNPLP